VFQADVEMVVPRKYLDLQPVGLWSSIAKNGPSEAGFCRICSRIAQLWGKKPVKNGPLRPFCSG
jgi:hypothetical protein